MTSILSKVLIARAKAAGVGRRYYYATPTAVSAGRSLQLVRQGQQQQTLRGTSTTLLGSNRSFVSTTTPVNQSESAVSTNVKQVTHVIPTKKQHREIVKLLEEERRKYNKELSKLRKEYLSEYRQKEEQKRSSDQIEQIRIREAIQKYRYQKWQRTIENARLQKEMQDARREEWYKQLEKTQKRREARNARYKMAQQLVVDELEKEAPLWLVSEDEVTEMFDDHYKMQHLWSRPGQYIGALPHMFPTPGIEEKESDLMYGQSSEYYWRYESETNYMQKSYKTPREWMLEQLNEELYMISQMDVSNQDEDSSAAWTQYNQQLQIMKEDRVRLRGLVEKLAIRKLVEDQLKQEALSSEGMKRSALQTYSSNTSHVNSHQRVPPSSFHPIREHWASSDRKKLEEAEYQVAMDPKHFRTFFEFPHKENTEGVTSVLLPPDSPMTVAPFDHYPTQLGWTPPEPTRSEKERKRLQKEEEALWEALGGNASGASASADAPVADDGQTDSLMYEIDQVMAAKGTVAAPGGATTPAEGESADASSTAVKSKDSDDSDDYDENELMMMNHPALKALEGGSELTKINDDDLEWFIDQLQIKHDIVEQEERLQRGVVEGDGGGEDDKSSVSTTSIGGSIEDLAAAFLKEEEAALQKKKTSMGVDSTGDVTTATEVTDDTVATTSAQRIVTAEELGEVDTELYLKAMHLLNELSNEQKEGLHKINAEMGGVVMASPEDATRFKSQLRDQIPSLSQTQIDAIVDIELSHMNMESSK